MISENTKDAIKSFILAALLLALTTLSLPEPQLLGSHARDDARISAQLCRSPSGEIRHCRAAVPLLADQTTP